MTRNSKIFTLSLLLLTCVFAWGATGYPHSGFDPASGSLEAPSLTHWLGTDDLGIDIFAQISVGFLSTAAVGLSAALVSFVLGGVVGVSAGYMGGRTDEFLSFLIHMFLSVPQMPIMIVVGAFMGQHRWNLVLIVALFSWAPIAKVVREKTASVKNRQYIKIAESYGANMWYVLTRHMKDEILPLLTISALAVMGKAIIQEASLAYMGLSDPLSRSWGLMINKCISFQGIYFTDYWKWWLTAPVVALLATTLCIRLLLKELEKHWLR